MAENKLNYTIRQLNASDSSVTMDYFRKAFQDVGSEETRSGFLKSLDDPEWLKTPKRWYGAFIGDTQIGVIACRKMNFNLISLICVDEEYREQGIGTELVKTVAGYCDNNVKEIYVNSTTDAADFFRKLGFQDAGEPEKYFGVRIIDMSCSRESLIHE